MNREPTISKAIRIKPDVWAIAKSQAAIENKTMGDWLEEAIKAKIKNEIV